MWIDWWIWRSNSAAPFIRKNLSIRGFWYALGTNLPQTQRDDLYVCEYCLNSFSCVQLFVTSWSTAHQTPLFMGFSRYEFWSGLPGPPPGDLPHPGIKSRSPVSPASQVILYCWPTRKTHGVILFTNKDTLKWKQFFLQHFVNISTDKFYNIINNTNNKNLNIISSQRISVNIFQNLFNVAQHSAWHRARAKIIYLNYILSKQVKIKSVEICKKQRRKKPLLIEQALMDIYNFIGNNHQAK